MIKRRKQLYKVPPSEPLYATNTKGLFERLKDLRWELIHCHVEIVDFDVKYSKWIDFMANFPIENVYSNSIIQTIHLECIRYDRMHLSLKSKCNFYRYRKESHNNFNIKTHNPFDKSFRCVRF